MLAARPRTRRGRRASGANSRPTLHVGQHVLDRPGTSRSGRRTARAGRCVLDGQVDELLPTPSCWAAHAEGAAIERRPRLQIRRSCRPVSPRRRGSRRHGQPVDDRRAGGRVVGTAGGEAVRSAAGMQRGPRRRCWSEEQVGDVSVGDEGVRRCDADREDRLAVATRRASHAPRRATRRALQSRQQRGTDGRRLDHRLRQRGAAGLLEEQHQHRPRPCRDRRAPRARRRPGTTHLGELAAQKLGERPRLGPSHSCADVLGRALACSRKSRTVVLAQQVVFAEGELARSALPRQAEHAARR